VDIKKSQERMKYLNETNEEFQKKRISAQEGIINISNQSVQATEEEIKREEAKVREQSKVLTEKEQKEVKEEEEEEDKYSSNSVIFNPEYPSKKDDVYVPESQLFETGL